MDLFVSGDFTLHSGEASAWKIDCDALTLSDLDTLARMAATVLPPYDEVVGIPTGGTKFAEALRRYRNTDSATPAPTLIVDDVLTTGASMKEARKKYGKNSIGLVIFARGPKPKWIRAMFTYSLDLGDGN